MIKEQNGLCYSGFTFDNFKLKPELCSDAWSQNYCNASHKSLFSQILWQTYWFEYWGTGCDSSTQWDNTRGWDCIARNQNSTRSFSSGQGHYIVQHYRCGLRQRISQCTRFSRCKTKKKKKKKHKTKKGRWQNHFFLTNRMSRLRPRQWLLTTFSHKLSQTILTWSGMIDKIRTNRSAEINTETTGTDECTWSRVASKTETGKRWVTCIHFTHKIDGQSKSSGSY